MFNVSGFYYDYFLFPFLELQLKDHHRPFKLRKVWAELLKKFTVVTDEVAEKGKLPLKSPSCMCIIRITLCFIVLKKSFLFCFFSDDLREYF